MTRTYDTRSPAYHDLWRWLHRASYEADHEKPNHYLAEVAQFLHVGGTQAQLESLRDKVLGGSGNEWLPARTPSEWASALDVSLAALKKYIADGLLERNAITTKRWQLRRKGFLALGGRLE